MRGVDGDQAEGQGCREPWERTPIDVSGNVHYTCLIKMISKHVIGAVATWSNQVTPAYSLHLPCLKWSSSVL